MSHASTARSSTARTTAPRPLPTRRPAPRLRVVTGTQARRSNTGFTVICSTLLALGLLALLLLNTARAEQSFALGELKTSSTTLQDNQRQLRSDLSNVSAPQQVALKAQEMGMAPAPKVTYVRASDHKVLGVANRPEGADPFTVGTLPDTPASRVADKAVGAADTVLVHKPKPKPKAKATAKPSASPTPKASGNSAPKASSSKDKPSTKPSASTPPPSSAAATPRP